MLRLRILHRRENPPRPKRARTGAPIAAHARRDEQGSSLLEFAIVLPLLVVLTVGIYDFSNAFNTRQKIAQAAQEGAILAGAQPTGDMQQTPPNQDSMQSVVVAIFNSLAASGILPNANEGTGCQMPPPTPTPSGAAPFTWTYIISNCNSAYSGDNLTITINRGWVCPSPCATGPPIAVGTTVTVAYPYRWRFASVIQLLFPQSTSNSYSAPTQIKESATVHNQM